MTISEFYTGLIDRYNADQKLSPHSQVGQLEYYKSLNLHDAIEDAVFGRYIVKGHQYYTYHYRFFPQEIGAQDRARENLFKCLPQLKKCNEFLDLYVEIRNATQEIPNLGLLFYYDTALRIGASNELNLYPKHVFLQRGSLWGAEATGIDLTGNNETTPYVSKRKFDQLTDNFKVMDAKDIEALLCVFHAEIKEFMCQNVQK